MTKHRSHSAAFKRQVAEEFIAGVTLHTLSKRHDISRQLIRIWVGKFEAGAMDDDVQAAEAVHTIRSISPVVIFDVRCAPHPHQPFCRHGRCLVGPPPVWSTTSHADPACISDPTGLRGRVPGGGVRAVGKWPAGAIAEGLA